MNSNNKIPKTFKLQPASVRVCQLLAVQGGLSQGDLLDKMIHGFHDRFYSTKTDLGRRYDQDMALDEAVIKALLDLDNAAISQQQFDEKMEGLKV